MDRAGTLLAKINFVDIAFEDLILVIMQIH